MAAVFFDVDGTLVRGTSSAQYLAGFLGHGRILAVAEAEWDAGLGFAASCGPRLESGLSMGRCAAIGDSRSDVPLFREVGLAVAFNGDEHVTAVADAQFRGDDLRMVLPALEAWLHRLDAPQRGAREAGTGGRAASSGH